MSAEIKDFEELIKPILKPGQKFVSYECENLLAPGENYGSIMLKVDVKILDENDKEDIIYTVAKTCPPPGFLWEAYNIKETFKKEIAMYKTIVPALNDFCKEKGINCLLDFFPKCLRARLSLDPNSDVVDEHAILLLENLKVQGYEMGDRYNGFDEDTAKYLLRELAILHATAIAYKAAKPDDFQEKMSEQLKKTFNLQINEETMNGVVQGLQAAASRNPECIPYLTKISEVLPTMNKCLANPAKGKEIFTTIVHNDYWINNTMLKYENGRLVSNKMVDFQLLGFNSLANDVIFFVYGNLHLSVMKSSKIDELIKFYYDEFIQVLIKLEHDVSEYSFESMMEEFAIMAKDFQFTRVLFMLNPMMLLKGKADEFVDLKELKADTNLSISMDVVHENYYPRVQFVLLDFVKRGWV